MSLPLPLLEPKSEPLAPGTSATLCHLCMATAPKFHQCFSAINQTVADVLNQHFGWFALDRDRDGDSFVCQPCWATVSAFHQFYQTVYDVHHQQLQFCAVNVFEESAAPHSVPPPDKAGDVVDGGETRPSLSDEWTDIKLLANTVEVKIEAATPDNDNDSNAEDAITDDNTDDVAQSDLPASPTTTDAATTTAHRIRRPKGATSVEVRKPPPSSKSKPVAKTRKPPRQRKYQVGKYADDNELLLRYMQMACTPCGLTFTAYADMRRHNVQCHPGASNVLRCCDRNYMQKFLAVEHCRWHENPHMFDCPQCDRSCYSSRALAEHLARRHPVAGQAPQHACDRCPRVYTTSSTLRLHISTVHQTRFECFDCHRPYGTLNVLRAHMRTQHERDAAPAFVCAVCAKLFKTRVTYKHHYETQHTQTAQTVAAQCAECGKWLRNADAVKRHSAMHRLDPPPCAQCGHRAAHEQAAAKHRRLVHRAPPVARHECGVCGKRFVKAHVLASHMATHTGHTDVCACRYCGQHFRHASLMYAHRKREHGAEIEAEQRRANEENARQRRRVEAELEAERARRRLAREQCV